MNKVHTRLVRVDIAMAKKQFTSGDTFYAGYFPNGSISSPRCICDENGFVILTFKTDLDDKEIERIINSLLINGAYITQIMESIM